MEFASLARSLAAGQMVSVASFEDAVDGFGFAALMVPLQECGFVFQPEGEHVAPWLASMLSDCCVPFRLDHRVAAFPGDEVAVST